MGTRADREGLVFCANSYHPIQAGSIDGTDIAPHDNGVYRALLCYNAGIYDPFGDPKVSGDPYCTLFVGRLSHLTTEDTLCKAMSKYGRVKNLRLVRHIVTGASRGYAFVEYENQREMRRAYEDAHHSYIDDSEIIVDYNRQHLMPGWIPRRLGGGFGGKKESGQLRFGGRERPFRAPLRPIPFEDLKRLGIPPPPEGRYMSRYQVPSPPRRRKSSVDREERYRKRGSMDREERFPERRSMDREEYNHRCSPLKRGERSESREVHSGRGQSSMERIELSHRSSPAYSKDQQTRSSVDREEEVPKRNYAERKKHSHERSSRDNEELSHIRSPRDSEEHSHRRSPHNKDERSHKRSFQDKDERSHKRSSRDKDERSHKRSSRDKDEHFHKRSSKDGKSHSHKRHKRYHSHQHEVSSPKHDHSSG